MTCGAAFTFMLLMSPMRPAVTCDMLKITITCLGESCRNDKLHDGLISIPLPIQL